MEVTMVLFAQLSRLRRPETARHRYSHAKMTISVGPEARDSYVAVDASSLSTEAEIVWQTGR
jgi:hypothetical protein